MGLALLDRAQQRLPDANEWTDGPGMGMADNRAAPLRSTSRSRARGNCTLDQLITARWRGLACGESVRCPVCDGQMKPCDGQTQATHGCCLDCGATLA
jgi:hypothetical protein